MWYVGLDVHSKSSTICVLNEDGKKQRSETIRGPWPKAVQRLERLEQPFSVCYEASLGHRYLYDALKQVAASVIVAHPGHLRLIVPHKGHRCIALIREPSD